MTSNGGGSYTANKLDSSCGIHTEVKAGTVAADLVFTVYKMLFVEPKSNEPKGDDSTVEITKDDMSTFYFSKKGSGVTTNDYIEKEILPAGDFSVSSSNSGIATVNKTTIGANDKYNGFRIVGVAAGTATVTIKIGSVARTLKIVVK